MSTALISLQLMDSSVALVSQTNALAMPVAFVFFSILGHLVLTKFGNISVTVQGLFVSFALHLFLVFLNLYLLANSLLYLLFFSLLAASSFTDFYSRLVVRPIFSVASMVGMLVVLEAQPQLSNIMSFQSLLFFVFITATVTTLFKMKSIDDIAFVVTLVVTLSQSLNAAITYISIFLSISFLCSWIVQRQGNQVELAFLPVICLSLTGTFLV